MAVAAGSTGGYDFAGAASESPAIQDLRQWLGSDLRSQPKPPPVELSVVSGVPGIEIGRLAERREADLLVLGRKQRSQLARVLLAIPRTSWLARAGSHASSFRPTAAPSAECWWRSTGRSTAWSF
jgi:nucleotide-binding universal stress UspA family protein